MKNIKYKFLFFISFLLIDNSYSGLLNIIQEATCSVLLRKFPVKKEAASQEFVTKIDRDPQNGKFGGLIYTVRKRKSEDPWFSLKETHPAAIQGDPRWFINTFGSKVASLFGFEQIDSQTLIVPNATEFSNAIGSVNRELAEKKTGHYIAVSFYVSKQDRVPVDDYLKNWAQSGSLPIAEGNMSMIHDLSYHAPAILIPPSIVELSKKQTQILLDFIDFLENNKGNFFYESLEGNVRYMKMLRLSEIDEGSGNTVLNLNVLSKGSRNKEILRQMSKIVAGGMSPKQFLQRYVSYFKQPALNELLKDFIKSRKDTQFLNSQMSKTEIIIVCKKIVDQINAIKTASQQLIDGSEFGTLE